MAQKTLYATATPKLCIFQKANFWLKPHWVYRNRLVKTIEKISSVKTAKHY
jgi:hypothetical protein